MRPIIELQFADFSTPAFNQIGQPGRTLYWRTRVPCRLPCACHGGTSGRRPFTQPSMEGIYAHYPAYRDDARYRRGCLQHVARSRRH